MISHEFTSTCNEMFQWWWHLKRKLLLLVFTLVLLIVEHLEKRIRAEKKEKTAPKTSTSLKGVDNKSMTSVSSGSQALPESPQPSFSTHWSTDDQQSNCEPVEIESRRVEFQVEVFNSVKFLVSIRQTLRMVKTWSSSNFWTENRWFLLISNENGHCLKHGKNFTWKIVKFPVWNGLKSTKNVKFLGSIDNFDPKKQKLQLETPPLGILIYQ